MKSTFRKRNCFSYSLIPSKFSIYYARDKTNFRFSYFITIYVSRGIFFLFRMRCFVHVEFFMLLFRWKLPWKEQEGFMRKDLNREKERRHRAIMDEECNWNFLPGNGCGWVSYFYRFTLPWVESRRRGCSS